MMCGGGKNQTTTSQVTIPPEVLARYNTVNNNAATVAATPFQQYSTDPNAFVAQTNSTEHQGTSDIAASGAQANLGSLNTQQYLNPYIQDVAQSTEGLLNQQNQQAMSGQLGNAAGSGAAFGDRSGVAAANLNQQQQLSSANILSNILSQGYTQAQGVAQQQQGAQLSAEQANLARQGAAGQAEVAAGQVQQQTDQAGKTALYNQFEQQQAYPFQTAQFQANIAEGTGANSGSTTTTTQPAGFFSGFAEGGTVEPRAGLAGGGQPPDSFGASAGLNPNGGAYGAGAANPGQAGYVPGANLPVGRLMIAAPPPPNQDHANVLAAASKISDLAKNGASDWQTAKNIFSPASTTTTATIPSSFYANGGTVRAGLATGGLPYDDTTIGTSYVPDNTPSQTPQLAVAPSADGKKSGGLGGLLSGIASIAGLFHNGGRAGFDDGGVPVYDWSNGLPPQTETTNAPPPVATTTEDAPVDPLAQPLPPARQWRTGLGSDIANLLVRGKDAKAASSIWNNGLTEAAPGSPTPTPAAGLVPDAPSSPSQASISAPAPSVPPSNGFSPAFSSDTSQYPLIEDNQVPAKAAGLQPTGMTDPKTMSPVPTAKSTGNALTMFSDAAINHESLAINHNDPNGGTLAGFNLAQYQAVNPNIRSLNEVTPNNIAVAQKNWYDAQGGDQLAQKYGPNFAAAYVDTSMLNPTVAKQALVQSGGDPNKFFSLVSGHLQNIAANQVKQGKPDYAKVWMTRIADNQKIAAGADPSSIASPSSNQGPLSAGLVANSNSQSPPSQNSAGLGGASIIPTGDQTQQPTGLDGARGFLDKNKDLLVPLLKGIGAMASSPSRYFGTALLQGAGAAADSYATYPKLQADIATQQAVAARDQQLIEQGDIYKLPDGSSMVRTKNGAVPYPIWMQNPTPTIHQPDNASNASFLAASQPSQTGNASQPKTTVTSGNGYASLSPEMQSLVKKNMPEVMQLNPERQGDFTTANNPYEDAATTKAQALRTKSNTQYLGDMLSGADPKDAGVVANNYIVPWLTKADQALNQITGANTSNLADLWGKGDTTSRNEVINKLQTQRANLVRQGVSQGELDTMVHMNPTLLNTPRGQGDLISGIMAQEIKDIKKGDVFDNFQQQFTNRGLQNRVQGSGRGLDSEFEKEEGPKFQQNKAILEDLFHLDYKGSDGVPVNGRPQTALSYLIHNGAAKNPALIEQLSKRYSKFGPNAMTDIIHYFGGSNG